MCQFVCATYFWVCRRLKNVSMEVNSRRVWAFLLLRASQSYFVKLYLHVCTVVEIAIQIIDGMRTMNRNLATIARDLVLPYFCASNCHGYIALGVHSMVQDKTCSRLQQFMNERE